jgi:hypothetical protein
LRRAGQIEACATNARILFCDGSGHGPHVRRPDRPASRFARSRSL